MTAGRWFLAACTAYVVAWMVAVVLLPARVPLHFDASGDADRWGGRGSALIAFAVLGIGLGGLLHLAARYVDRIPVSLLNTPHKDWWTATPERLAELRRRTTREVRVIGAATMALLTALVLCTVRAARAEVPRLDWIFFACLVAYLVFIVVWVVRLYRDRRAIEGG